MTTPETEFAQQVTRYLDIGTASLRQGTAYRLQSARQEALARAKQGPSHRIALHPVLRSGPGTPPGE